MNCIIIDDDKLSRKILEEFISKTDFLTLVDSFDNGIDAINVIKSGKPVHLIFLDIEMPEMNGIEFLNSLKNSPQIIIISSKERYALEAFEYDVTDYLLKPFVYGRFFKAVDKAFNRYSKEYFAPQGKSEIFIKKNSALVKIKYDEILWVEALENYVIVHTFSDKITIHFTMKAIEKKLPASKFVRVHRSFIVNIGSIVQIEDNNIKIAFQAGQKIIPIGKSYRDNLMNDLNLMIK